MPYDFILLFLPSSPTQNNMEKFQNVHTHWHLHTTVNREFRAKGTFGMASHSYKMHDVEEMFLELYRSICTEKIISEPYQ